MYERFTDRARRVIALAHDEARHWNHGYIGTDHILLGLIAAGAGGAIKVLESLTVDPKKLHSDIARLLVKGPDPVGDHEWLPKTPRASAAIDYAIEEARALKHPQVGTAHILLGLLRETEGVASHVLANRGVNLKEAREQTMKLGRGEPLSVRPSRHREIEDLPIELHIPAADLDAELKSLNSAKEDAVESQDFELAAAIRDKAEPVRRKRKSLLKEWIERCQFDPAWLSANGGAAVKLARKIGEQRCWNQLPDLAAALDLAGCNDFQILSHCRQPGEHSSNCWVVDLLLAKAHSWLRDATGRQ